jgi:hypothetical protein
MTDTSEIASQQRDRSPAFPVIPLETALARLAEFETHFKRTPSRPDKVGDAWGIKTKTYADRIAAAARYFGLLEYQGTGKDRSVTVSEDGRKYLRTQAEETKRQLVKAAALRPKQIAKYWEDWGTDRPADPACLDALMDSGFSEAGARDFLKVYDATISFAKLSDSDKASDGNKEPDEAETADPLPQDVAVGDLIQVEIAGALQLASPKRVRAVQDHDGRKWVFIEGSETGIPMEQVRIEQKGAGAGKAPLSAPILPEIPDARLPAGEREWLRGPLSKEASYRLIVAGDLGPKEIGKLITLLKAQQAVLADEDTVENDEAAN